MRPTTPCTSSLFTIGVISRSTLDSCASLFERDRHDPVSHRLQRLNRRRKIAGILLEMIFGVERVRQGRTANERGEEAGEAAAIDQHRG